MVHCLGFVQLQIDGRAWCEGTAEAIPSPLSESTTGKALVGFVDLLVDFTQPQLTKISGRRRVHERRCGIGRPRASSNHA